MEKLFDEFQSKVKPDTSTEGSPSKSIEDLVVKTDLVKFINRRNRQSQRLEQQRKKRDKVIAGLRDIGNLSDEEDLKEEEPLKLAVQDEPRIPTKVSRSLRKQANKLADQLDTCLSFI